jgi:hypothetical protein
VAVSAAEHRSDEPQHVGLLWRVLLSSVVSIFNEFELRMKYKVVGKHDFGNLHLALRHMLRGCASVPSLGFLHLVTEHFPNIQFAQFTGERLQRGECAASVTVRRSLELILIHGVRLQNL